MTLEWRGPSDSTRIGSTQWDSSWPGFLKDEKRAEILGYLEERFGIPARLFDDYSLLEAGSSWWMLRRSPYAELAAVFKVFACGIRAFQKVGRFVKPTTRFIQLFGHAATKSVLSITEEEFRRLLEGQGIRPGQEMENGYVLLKLDGVYVLGLGLVIRGLLRSQIRKSDFPSGL